MKANIEALAKEIYMIDPTLKKRDKEIKKALSALVSAKPDVVIDRAFVQNLRRMLMTKGVAPKTSMHLWVRYIASGVGGAVLTALVLTPMVMSRTEEGMQAPILSPAVQDVGNRAFGSLTAENAAQSARPQSGGGMGGGGLVTSEAAVDSKMIAPAEPFPAEKIVRLSYAGTPLVIPQTSGMVFRRASMGQGIAMSQILNRSDFGFMNINKFRGLEVTNLNLTEADENGYALWFGFDTQTASINLKQPAGEAIVFKECVDRSCMPGSLSINDVPSDDELISLADKFLNDYGIETSFYGDPVVNHFWKTDYERATLAGEPYFIPTDLSVVYPYSFEDQPAVDNGGNPIGMTVNIHIPKRKVTGVWGISSNRFESSKYPLENDAQKIIQKLESLPSYIQTNASTQTLQATVGEPTLVYVSSWKQEGDRGYEIFSPALSFPVTSWPDGIAIYQRSIVVPLAKDVLENWEPSYPVIAY